MIHPPQTPPPVFRPGGLLPALGALALAAGLVGAAGSADAIEKTRMYGKATAPYWEVGTLDKELSRLCRQGRFNQRKKDGLFIGYAGDGPDGGHTITGIAKQGYNLFDPLKKSEPAVTYHFHNDGYSTCRVYVAREQPGAAGQPQ